ncbi:MAG TPA: hypothetical protein VJ343_03000, partial [archaeon]|nr:hypothetical protein [archaeon]
MGILERVIDNIQKIKTQGARSIAIAGLWAIKEVAKRDGFGKEFGRACKLLESSRPTAVALYNAIEDVRKKKTLEEINRMIYYFENVASLIVSQNYKIIKNNSTILTHCHSTLVVELLEKAWEKKIKFKVIVTETRPLFQGKKTAKELSEIGIPVIFITDSAAGFFIKDVDSVLMGVDAIRKEGVVNKIGSYPLAVLAKENDIPVYFAGETMKL